MARVVGPKATINAKEALTESVRNAMILAELITDPNTTPTLQVTILAKLLESKQSTTFFNTMFDSNMSFGECPKCRAGIHWMIPEAELNKLGYVTSDHVEGVEKFTKAEDCSRYQEACAKRKINP